MIIRTRAKRVMVTKMSKTYAVDFDGTLCSNLYPQIGEAKQDVIDKLIKLKEEGNNLILWTCRTGDKLNEAIEWCNEKGLSFDEVNDNLQENKEKYDEDSRKVIADYYLDDKALTIESFLFEENIENNKKEGEKVSKVLKFKTKDKKGKSNRVGSMEFKNENGTQELYFYGDIVDDTWSKWSEEDRCPQDIVNILDSIDENQDLNIYINSGGGSVYAGIAIYNQLKRKKCNKIVRVDGLAASIASIIMLSGDTIIIPKTAQTMIHEPWLRVWGGFNASELRKLAEDLDACREIILNVYAENLKEGVDIEEISSMMKAETWLTGEKASQYFNIEVEDSSEAVACASNYFEEYKNVPENFKRKNNVDTEENSIDIKSIAKEVAKLLKEDKSDDIKNLEEEKMKILEDLDYI